MSVRVQGVPELSGKLAAIAHSVTEPESWRIYLVAARKIRNVARSLAPVVKGTLKKSIVAKAAKRGQYQNPAAYTMVNLFKQAVRAPHGSWVSFGTYYEYSRKPKSKKFLKFKGLGGDMIFTKRVKPMPENPYFQRAVDTAGPAALEAALIEQKKIIEGVARRAPR